MRESVHGITVQEIVQIINDDALCQAILKQDGSFYHEKYTQEEILMYVDRFFQGLIYLIERDQKFHIVPLLTQVFMKFYAPKIENKFELIYTNKNVVQMILLYKKYPAEFVEIGKFLKKINFEFYHNELYCSYQTCIKNDIIIEESDFDILLYYTLFYKKQKLPAGFLYYIVKLLLENYSKKEIDLEIMAYLLQHIAEDILEQNQIKGSSKLAILEQGKKAIYKNSILYLNYYEVCPYLKDNLEMIDFIFVLLEKRNKNIGMVHNKYEEVKIEKEQCIKDMIGSLNFLQSFSYLGVQTEIEIGSLLKRIHYFKNISNNFYQKLLENYKTRINKEKITKQEIPGSLILSIDQLMENVIYLVPDLTSNKDFLRLEYLENNKRKTIVELVHHFDEEIKESKQSKNLLQRQEHLKLARYYEMLILKYPLDVVNIVEQYIELIHFPVVYEETKRLLGQIMTDYFVRQMNQQLRQKTLSFTQLEKILSHLNVYMTKYYHRKMNEINKILPKDPQFWLQENKRLNQVYEYVHYINTPALYESSSLDVTEFLPLEQLQIKNKIALQKKIWHQRIYMVILVILILIFSLSLCFLIRIFMHYQSASNRYEQAKKYVDYKDTTISIPKVPDTQVEYKIPEFPRDDTIPNADFAKLKSQNEEIIGWITFDSGVIDYPIAKGSNNTYYLSHLYDKSYNISGSIFADYRISDDFSLNNSVLYGHNLRNETMFGSLKRYRDETYFKDNPYFWLITEKTTYRYQIYAAYEFDSMVEKYEFNFNSEADYQTYLDHIREKSLWKSDLEVTTKDTIMTLSTCTNDPNAMRFLVIAKRIAIYKDN